MTPVPLRQQLLRFLNQPLGQLFVNSGLDPTIQGLAFPRQADQQRRERRLAECVGSVHFGKRTTQEMMHFQCSDDLHQIMRMQPIGQLRVNQRERIVKMSGSFEMRLIEQPRAEAPICLRALP